jgi:hypothetical protein
MEILFFVLGLHAILVAMLPKPVTVFEAIQLAAGCILLGFFVNHLLTLYS